MRRPNGLTGESVAGRFSIPVVEMLQPRELRDVPTSRRLVNSPRVKVEATNVAGRAVMTATNFNVDGDSAAAVAQADRDSDALARVGRVRHARLSGFPPRSSGIGEQSLSGGGADDAAV